LKSRSIIGSMSMPGRPESTTTHAIQPRAWETLAFGTLPSAAESARDPSRCRSARPARNSRRRFSERKPA